MFQIIPRLKPWDLVVRVCQTNINSRTFCIYFQHLLVQSYQNYLLKLNEKKLKRFNRIKFIL